MCYSEPVSWTAFIIGTIVNILLILTFKHIPIVVALALFFQFVVMVQLFEALAWRGYESIGANGILILTSLQPIVLGLLVLYINDNEIVRLILGTLIVFYMIWLVYSLNNSPEFNSLKKGECGHLDYSFWRNIGSLPYFLLLFIVILCIVPSDIALIVLITVMATLFLSQFIYTCNTETPSLWCLFSVITPIILYIYLMYRGYSSTLNEMTNFL